MVFFLTPIILFILLLRKVSLEFEWIFYRCQTFNLQSKGRYWSFVFLLNPVQPYFWIRVNFLSKEPKSLMNQRKIRDKRGVSSWHWFWLGSFKKMVAALWSWYSKVLPLYAFFESCGPDTVARCKANKISGSLNCLSISSIAFKLNGLFFQMKTLAFHGVFISLILCSG